MSGLGNIAIFLGTVPSATVRLPGSETNLVDLWLPFGFLGAIAWSVWLGRRMLTALYRPVQNDHWELTSIVAPAFREDPDIVVACVQSWLAAGANDVILVFPEDEEYNIARINAALGHETAVRLLTTDNPAKRNSLRIGIEAATQPIVVLTDSDTLWEPDLLEHLLMPFADPKVGGVGTRQRVLDAENSVWRRAAEWMLDTKYLTYIPAMARKGGVSCLSGRTAAYRRSVLLDVLPDMVNETFLGRKCVSGDDGRITWLVLNQGYKTAYQQNALAWTMMPDTAKGFFMQRLRWSRNSYRCYLRAIFRGWLFKQPLITRVSVLQMLLAPISLSIGFVFVGLSLSRADWVAAGAWAIWITCGRGIRAFDHLSRNPRNIMLLPLMTFLILFALTAIKYYTFFTMNKQAWITRRQDRGVAEGQSIDTLTVAPGLPTSLDLPTHRVEPIPRPAFFMADDAMPEIVVNTASSPITPISLQADDSNVIFAGRIVDQTEPPEMTTVSMPASAAVVDKSPTIPATAVDNRAGIFPIQPVVPIARRGRPNRAERNPSRAARKRESYSRGAYYRAMSDPVRAPH